MRATWQIVHKIFIFIWLSWWRVDDLHIRIQPFSDWWGLSARNNCWPILYMQKQKQKQYSFHRRICFVHFRVTICLFNSIVTRSSGISLSEDLIWMMWSSWRLLWDVEFISFRTCRLPTFGKVPHVSGEESGRWVGKRGALWGTLLYGHLSRPTFRGVLYTTDWRLPSFKSW